jgi:thiol-disulfide isomerase/thioredoxin
MKWHRLSVRLCFVFASELLYSTGYRLVRRTISRRNSDGSSSREHPFLFRRAVRKRAADSTFRYCPVVTNTKRGTRAELSTMNIQLAVTSLAALLPIASSLSAQIVAPATKTTPVRPAAPAGAVPPAAAAPAPATQAAAGDAAKTAPATIDEKAKAIYDKGVAAARALKTIDLYTQTKIEMDGIDPAMLPPGFGAKSRVRIQFADDGEAGFELGGKVSIERMDDGNSGKVVERFVAGKDAGILVMPEAKTFAQGDSLMELMGPAAMAMPQWILEQRASGKPNREAGGMVLPESKLISAHLAGTETIDDLECDVVKTVRELDMSSVLGDGEIPEGMPATMKLAETIAFARTDGLPRQISMMPVMEEMGEDDGIAMMVGPRTTWTAVNANSELAADLFSTTPPEGFTKVDPPESVKGFAIGGEAGGAERPEPELAVKVGDAAPDFTLKDLAGTEVSLASLKGKVIVLDFWATWCGPCKAAMPVIQKLHDDYAAKGVAVLGVNTWEQNQKAVKNYIESKKYTYPCLLDGDKLAEAYGVPGIPTLVVIGKDGKVVLTEIGLADASGGALRKAIDAALGAP